MKKVIEETIAGLVWVNRSDKDYCELSDLTSDWKKILSDYMALHYIKCNAYEVHNKYFIAIEDVDEDTLTLLNRAKVVIYSIDYIVDTIVICFKDAKSRDLVFDVLKGEVA